MELTVLVFDSLIVFLLCFSQGNLRYWLEDPDCRDQYSVIFESGDRTSIFWNDIKEPVQIEDRAVSVLEVLEIADTLLVSFIL